MHVLMHAFSVSERGATNSSKLVKVSLKQKRTDDVHGLMHTPCTQMGSEGKKEAPAKLMSSKLVKLDLIGPPSHLL